MSQESFQTTYIEGTRLTLEAAGLLTGRDVPGADADDASKVLNFREAFAFVSVLLNNATLGPWWKRACSSVGQARTGWSTCWRVVPAELATNLRHNLRQRCDAKSR
ncbi:MAG: hypothetical protein F4X83_00615 [Chloroflexi bacterium]|nr:hypothetical protein [Chloroflexota bacterium]